MTLNSTARESRDKNIFFVVDDDPFILELVTKSIQTYGTVKTFASANDLIKNYEKESPDILFLDIHMGEQSGMDLLEEVVKIDPKANVHMLSADSTVENITKCIRLGARSFIGKPFTQQKLIEALNRCPTIKGT